MSQAHYDDPDFSYVNYWQGRDYEHEAEVAAIRRIINGRRFAVGADVGGGYGRLTALLADCCERVYLVEPAEKQLQIARGYCPENVIAIKATGENTTLRTGEVDLALVVRVSHHLPDLRPMARELARIVKPGGTLIFEIANSVNFKSRIWGWLSGKKISDNPIEKRSPKNRNKHTIDFVNHDPAKTIFLFGDAGFRCVKRLSVSNFRSVTIKSLVPVRWLVAGEKLVQVPLGYFNFGPSVFVQFIRN